MDEQRKYGLLFAATILAARKLIEMEPHKPNLAFQQGVLNRAEKFIIRRKFGERSKSSAINSSDC